MLSGVVVVAVACVLVRGAWRESALWRRAAAALFVAALFVQACAACVYTYGYELSVTHNVLHFREYGQEARQFLRDRRLTSYLSDEERARSRTSARGSWAAGSRGAGSHAQRERAAIAVNYQEFLTTRESKRQFVRAFEAAPAERIYRSSSPKTSSQAKDFIRSRGLEITSKETVEVPLFSPTHRLGMMLLRVAVPVDAEARAKFESSWMSAAFPESDYRAGLEWAAPPPTSMRAGERATLSLRVRNDGPSVWPARGDTRGMFQVNAGDRWLDAEAARVINDLDGRRALESDLAPGASAQLNFDVTAPREPGEYTLKWT